MRIQLTVENQDIISFVPADSIYGYCSSLSVVYRNTSLLFLSVCSVSLMSYIPDN